MSLTTSYQGYEFLLEHRKIDAVGVTISLVSRLYSDIGCPLNRLLVSSNFRTLGHPHWKKPFPLFHGNPISLPTSAPVHMCQVSLTIFERPWLPRPLITLVCFLWTHYIRGGALPQGAVGWNAMLQAFIWSVQSRCKPERPDTQRPPFHAFLLQILICLRSPLGTPAFFLKPTPVS